MTNESIGIYSNCIYKNAALRFYVRKIFSLTNLLRFFLALNIVQILTSITGMKFMIYYLSWMSFQAKLVFHPNGPCDYFFFVAFLEINIGEAFCDMQSKNIKERAQIKSNFSNSGSILFDSIFEREVQVLLTLLGFLKSSSSRAYTSRIS